NLPPVCSPRGPNCTNSPLIVATLEKWSAIFCAALEEAAVAGVERAPPAMATAAVAARPIRARRVAEIIGMAVFMTLVAFVLKLSIRSLGRQWGLSLAA